MYTLNLLLSSCHICKRSDVIISINVHDIIPNSAPSRFPLPEQDKAEIGENYRWECTQ